jgi:hypothetical protein
MTQKNRNLEGKKAQAAQLEKHLLLILKQLIFVYKEIKELQ